MLKMNMICVMAPDNPLVSVTNLIILLIRVIILNNFCMLLSS